MTQRQIDLLLSASIIVLGLAYMYHLWAFHI